MLKTTVKLLPFLFLILITVNSCKKKNDQKSKTQLITEKDWKALKIEEKENNDPWFDYLAGADVCYTDDRYVFRVNNTYEINEGPTKCNASDPQVYETGTWSLGDNETKFIYDGNPFTIDQLTDNSMILSYSVTVGPDTYYAKLTFAH